jgi:RecA-family ATPase
MSASTKAPAPMPPRLDVLKALTTSPPLPDFVLPGLPAGSVGALVAPGATGKTLLLLQLCAALAAGMPVLEGLFCGACATPVVPAKVAIVVAEETMDLMHARLHAVVAQLLLSVRPMLTSDERDEVTSRLAENLHIYPLAGRFRMRLDECDPTWGDGLEALHQLSTGIRLVVLDPLRQFHGGDENDSWAMTKLVQDLQVVAAAGPRAVLVAHHTNKWASANGQGDRAGASRGSAAFTDAVRWQLNLSPLDDETGRGFGIIKDLERYIKADLAKANYLPPQRPVVFRRETGGAFSRVTPSSAESSTASKSSSRRSRT